MDIVQSRFILGLTGQTGAGKSTVATYLATRGFTWINADAIAHNLQQIGSPCLKMIFETFGKACRLPDGALNRQVLAKIVFSDNAQLSRLNAIMYPAITRVIREQLNNENKSPFLLDAPTLFEAGLDTLCDKIVAVIAPESVRLRRIMCRDNIDENAAHLRMQSQHTESFFREKCDFIIDNNSDEKTLEKKVEELIMSLQRNQNQ